jgi:hypothetical protein
MQSALWKLAIEEAKLSRECCCEGIREITSRRSLGDDAYLSVHPYLDR